MYNEFILETKNIWDNKSMWSKVYGILRNGKVKFREK